MADGTATGKGCARVDAYGSMDELNAHLGLLAALLGDTPEGRTVSWAQGGIFRACAVLALAPGATFPPGETAEVEKRIDSIQEGLPPQRGFVFPGGCEPSARAHVCRTVCRRAERAIFSIGELSAEEKEVAKYANRLSDLLFVLARRLDQLHGTVEKIWDGR